MWFPVCETVPLDVAQLNVEMNELRFAAGAFTSTSRSLITFEKFALLLVCALNPSRKLASPFSSPWTAPPEC